MRSMSQSWNSAPRPSAIEQRVADADAARSAQASKINVWTVRKRVTAGWEGTGLCMVGKGQDYYVSGLEIETISAGPSFAVYVQNSSSGPIYDVVVRADQGVDHFSASFARRLRCVLQATGSDMGGRGLRGCESCSLVAGSLTTSRRSRQQADRSHRRSLHRRSEASPATIWGGLHIGSPPRAWRGHTPTAFYTWHAYAHDRGDTSVSLLPLACSSGCHRSRRFCLHRRTRCSRHRPENLSPEVRVCSTATGR